MGQMSNTLSMRIACVYVEDASERRAGQGYDTNKKVMRLREMECEQDSWRRRISCRRVTVGPAELRHILRRSSSSLIKMAVYFAAFKGQSQLRSEQPSLSDPNPSLPMYPSMSSKPKSLLQLRSLICYVSNVSNFPNVSNVM